MTTMTAEAMQEINGGGWLDIACGIAVGAAAAAAGVIAAAPTAGVGAPVAFAVTYSLAVPLCGVAAFS